MQEIGTELKRLREQKGLTLEEAQQGTKIRIRYLEAIETGELDALPGIVYARGFIKSYAEFLGVNGQELLDTYGVAVAPAETVPVEMPRRAAKSTSVRMSSFNGARVLPQVLAGVGVVAVCVMGYFLITYPGTHKQASNPQTKTQEAPKTAVQPVPKPSAPAPAPIVQPTPPPQPKAVIEQQQKAANKTVYAVSGVPNLSLQVSTQDNCWIQVVADGKTILSGIMKKGETHTWQANKSLSLMTAKSPYMAVKVNDQPVTLVNVLRGYTYYFQTKL